MKEPGFLEVTANPENILVIYLSANISLLAVLIAFQVRSGQKRNFAINATFLIS